ncbi:hypothetical protein ACFWN7_11245 [Agromyces sp. NPDC058484]|uniref:hypothetical protein n=1 Tax=Agromyces sp. NPDC058484 TaxID=3346524 RepID=UPI003660413C
MATAIEDQDARFPVFEFTYSDNQTGEATTVRSTDGILFARVANGGAFRSITARIISSRVPLKLKYGCRYRRLGQDGELSGEALEGERCPPGGADHITRIAFESKIYYRCWMSHPERPDEYLRDPAGAFWYPSGQFCGAVDDGRWITALEIKMPPIVEGWRSA